MIQHLPMTYYLLPGGSMCYDTYSMSYSITNTITYQ